MSTERRDLKRAIRAEVKADFNKRYPRLNGKRLTFLVNQKADMLVAQGVIPRVIQKTAEAEVVA